MKKLLALVLVLLCLCSAASATILPATGVDEDFYDFTGIKCLPTVVLCESLTILDARGDQGGKKVGTLRYSGEVIPVIESWDGYAQIYYADGQKTGWVRNDYLLLDPAWYLCDDSLQVYAYPDLMAPRVALLDEGVRLPILTQLEADGQKWVCVSLRGASGWIRKTPADTVEETWFRTTLIQNVTSATLLMGEEIITIDDPHKLDFLEEMLFNASDLGGPMAGCPFGAVLILDLADGSNIQLALATDSCCAYRMDNRDYQYARNLKTDPDSSVDNALLYDLFGVEFRFGELVNE